MHFQWTWVGLIATDSDNAEQFMKDFPPLASRSGVCVAFSLTFAVSTINLFGPEKKETFLSSDAFRLWKDVNVLVYYGEMRYFGALFLYILILSHMFFKPPVGKISITTALYNLNIEFKYNILSSERVDGVFSFLLWENRRLNWQKFNSHYPTIKQSGQEALHFFTCAYSKPSFSVKGRGRCAETENLNAISQDIIEKIHSNDHYFTFYALHGVAGALHAAVSSGSKQTFGRERFGSSELKPWQVFLSLPKQLNRLYHSIILL